MRTNHGKVSVCIAILGAVSIAASLLFIFLPQLTAGMNYQIRVSITSYMPTLGLVELIFGLAGIKLDIVQQRAYFLVATVLFGLFLIKPIAELPSTVIDAFIPTALLYGLYLLSHIGGIVLYGVFTVGRRKKLS